METKIDNLMKDQPKPVGEKPPTSENRRLVGLADIPSGWRWAVGGLVVCFAWPLFKLIRFSLGHDLYSHIVLVPFISGYLVWIGRETLSGGTMPPFRPLAAVLFTAGGGVLAAFAVKLGAGMPLAPEDSLALTTLAFVLIFAGLCALHLGRDLLRAFAFPLAFLLFMVPMPAAVVAWVETFLQHGSAYVAGIFFKFSTTPVLQQELQFQLPGIRIQVAPECSGIHSSLVLFITSLLAGHFFLKSPVNRILLAFAVLPLALLRNGFRVFVIGELCARISPDMIDSYIHHHGGPIFFALSLIPFFFLLFALIKRERARGRTTGGPA